jgi:transposase
MQKPKDKADRTLFVYAPLDELIPDDHILKQADRYVDFSWIRGEVKHLYCPDNGRPWLDPECALRLMVAGFFEGIVQDRKLCRKAATDIAIRWFAGLTLQDPIPDHSTFTRLRKRWGVDTFKKVFERALAECVEAGLVNADNVHVDSTLIRANVSWNRMIQQHVDQVISENAEVAGTELKRICETDPDATLATNSEKKPPEPSYKQHVAVNDNGVVLAVKITTGSTPEGHILGELIEEVEERTGERVENVTADKGYASAANFDMLEEMGINGVIPTKLRKNNGFSYDSLHESVICPKGRRFGHSKAAPEGRCFRIKARECGKCENRDKCFGRRNERTVIIRWGIEALLRAERRKAKGWDDGDRELYARHWNLVEGVQGEMKNEHGLKRAIRRGEWNIWVQSLMTAAVINLKRAIKALFDRFLRQFSLPFGLLGPNPVGCAA